jgi:hypothetical protein
MALAKESVKTLKGLIEEAVATLNHPYEMRDVECEWEIAIEANAKRLTRKDTGEVIETRGLSAEDRQREVDRVAALNQARTPVSASEDKPKTMEAQA